MRSAGNLHPDWGYLAPKPSSFMRTVRIALLASVIGAVGGVAVVVFLVDSPASDQASTSIAAHALVTSTPVMAAPLAPPGPVASPQAVAQPRPETAGSQFPDRATREVTGAVAHSPGANEAIAPTSAPLPSAAAPAQTPATKATVKAAEDAAPAIAPVQEGSTRKHHLAASYTRKRWRRPRHLFDEYRERGYGRSGSMPNDW